MQQPLVLAIEPDIRQAAIVKRIVREKVLADVAVVDSRDAALEAMRTAIPDVLLLSTLLSPRDEDELIAHLRTLRDAEHLQTHTIPQLASSIGAEDAKPKGLLAAFRRKKGPDQAASGCDPDLFAEEIRTYLKRASEKKREVRETGAMAPVASPHVMRAAATAAAKPSPIEEASAESSWSSPFEWRPTQTRISPLEEQAAAPAAAPDSPSVIEEPMAPMPEPISVIAPPPPVEEPVPVAASAPAPIADWRSLIKDPEPVSEPGETEPLVAAFVTEAAEPEPLIAASVASAEEPEPLVAEPIAVAMERELIYEPIPEPVAEPTLAPVMLEMVPAPRVRGPLTMRTLKGWWFVEGKEERAAGDPHSEMKEVLASLAVPSMIAGVAYAEGCRIRRVRLTEAA